MYIPLEEMKSGINDLIWAAQCCQDQILVLELTTRDQSSTYLEPGIDGRWRTQLLNIHASASEGRSTGLQQTKTLTVSFALSMEVVQVLTTSMFYRVC